MASIFESLTSQLGGGVLEQIAGQIGSRRVAEQAVPAVLGTLMGALANNSSRGDGAGALHEALARDHDGSILDDLPGFLSQSGAGGGAGMLKHILGDKRASVETGLGQQLGIDKSQITQLLTMLAPIVLGALGKAQRKGGLDAGGLTSMLGGERSHIQRRAPEGIGVLGGLLDADGDGQIADDVARIGGGLLKRFFGRKR